jgi:quinol monooxygenase YgiN
MLALFVTFSVKPGNEAQAKEYMRAMEEQTRREPGCHQYVGHQAEDDPCRFAFYERYDDHAALEAHRAAPYFQRYITNGLGKIMENRVVAFFNTLE